MSDESKKVAASGRITDAVVDEYYANLAEHYRPPSRGGNTRALHQHAMIIAGVRYSFLALGAKKWVFKGDTVSFDWVLKADKYRNVILNTMKVRSRNGAAVVRGDRGRKPALRTAPPKAPASRREQRD